MSILIRQAIDENLEPDVFRQKFISTGFAELDQIIKGYQVGECSIIAAQTGVGKTWFVVSSILKRPANKPTLVFSAEMGMRALSERIFHEAMQLNWTDYNNKELILENEAEFSRRFSEYENISFVEGRGMTIDAIESYMATWTVTTPKTERLVFIDCLQNIANPNFGDSNTTKDERLSNVLTRLLKMSRQYHCAIVIMAQIDTPNPDSISYYDEPNLYGDWFLYYDEPNLYDCFSYYDKPNLCKNSRSYCDEPNLYDLQKYSFPVQDAAVVCTLCKNNPVVTCDTSNTLYKMTVVKSQYGKGEGLSSFFLRRNHAGGFYTKHSPVLDWHRCVPMNNR